MKLMAVGSGMSEPEIEKIGLNEAIELISAIITVNKYDEVYAKIKKAMARLPQQENKKEIGLPA